MGKTQSGFEWPPTEDMLGFWALSPVVPILNISKRILDFLNMGTGTINDITVSTTETLTNAIKEARATEEGFWLTSFRNSLQASGMSAAQTNHIIGGLRPLLESDTLLGAIKSCILVIAGFTSSFSRITDIAGQFTTLDMNRRVPTNWGSYGELISAHYKKPTTANYKERVKDLGILPEWQEVMEAAYQEINTIGDVMTLWRRGEIAEEDVNAQLRRCGVRDQEDVQRIKLLRYFPLDPPPLTAAMHRGKLSTEDFLSALDKLGISPDNAKLLLNVSERILNEGIILNLFYKGRIPKADALKRLEQLGYSADNASNVVNAAQRQVMEIDLRTMFWRNIIGEPEYRDRLKKLSYGSAEVDLMVKRLWLKATPSDLIRFAVRDIYTPSVRDEFKLYQDFPEVFGEKAREIGIPVELAKDYWAAHWDLPAPGQGYDMYHRGIITKDQLALLLKALDVNPFWRDKMMLLADRLIPRRTLAMMIAHKIMTASEAWAYYVKLGYSHEDAILLVNLDFARAHKAEKELTKAEIMNGYATGVLNTEEAREQLLDLGYSPDAVSYYIAEAERRRLLNQKAAKLTPNEGAAAKAWDVLTKEILSMMKNGMVSEEEATGMLVSVGYEPETAGYLLLHTQLEIAEEEMEDAADEIEVYYKNARIDKTTAVKNVGGIGYSAEAAQRVVNKWEREVRVKAYLDTIPTRKPTLATIAKWLNEGIITVDEWRAYMRELGYGEREQLYYLKSSMVQKMRFSL